MLGSFEFASNGSVGCGVSVQGVDMLMDVASQDSGSTYWPQVQKSAFTYQLWPHPLASLDANLEFVSTRSR